MEDDYQPIRAGARENPSIREIPDEPRPPNAGGGGGSEPPGWERGVIEKLALGLVQEKRRARRWSIFFRLAYLALIIAGGLLLLGRSSLTGGDDIATGRHTALVELNGVISAEGEASAENLNTALQNAFKDRNTVGVVLRINSPGGSPVQAGIVHDEILRLRAKYPKVPLYAVVEEICASGGYYVAAAADRIFVDKASLVGSIGVLMDGFGFVDTLDKLGVERRLLTAGRNKGFLDSFSPMNDEQRQYAQKMLDEIHQQFIDVVRKGRGDRLKETPDTFSGLFWTGSQSVGMGLADDFGTVGSVARDVVKAESVVDFSTRENVAEKLARRLGARTADSLAGSLRNFLESPHWR
ncbi:MAG: S49 family peptidase [Burkholderiaceae bacterium]